MICSRLYRTHTQQRINRGCGADSSCVCSPVGVRQLLVDAVPGFCLGLSNIICVRDGAVKSNSLVDWFMRVWK